MPYESPATSSLTVDDLHFELRGSAQRRTLEVTADRSGELILHVPPNCDSAAVEQFVREKRPWIFRKLAEKEALSRPGAKKQYVNGEGFLYLGRSFRLLLVDEQSVPVKREAGRFKLRRSAAADGRAHMVHWYTVHAQRWLAEAPRHIIDGPGRSVGHHQALRAVGARAAGRGVLRGVQLRRRGARP